MSTVTIGGVTVDASDPCALLGVLRPAYFKMLAGETEAEIRHGETSIRLNVYATNLTELRSVIERLEAECAAKQGRRRRYATSFRFRREY